jgi:hypothetical protein
MSNNVSSTNLDFHHHYGGWKIRAKIFFSTKPIFLAIYTKKHLTYTLITSKNYSINSKYPKNSQKPEIKLG